MKLPEIILRELDYLKEPSPSDIKKVRESLNLRTLEASRLIGVSRRTWERYENGTLTMSKSNWLFLTLIANEHTSLKLLSFGE